MSIIIEPEFQTGGRRMALTGPRVFLFSQPSPPAAFGLGLLTRPFRPAGSEQAELVRTPTPAVVLPSAASARDPTTE
jgi:hypothetical protein